MYFCLSRIKLKSECLYLKYMVYLCSYVKTAEVLLVMDFLGALNPKLNPRILQTRAKSVKGRWQYKKEKKKKKKDNMKNFVADYIFCWYNLYRYWKRKKEKRKKQKPKRQSHEHVLCINHSSFFFSFLFLV